MMSNLELAFKNKGRYDEIMRTCTKCNVEMVSGCNVTTFNPKGITITKVRKGLFNNISSEVHAAVCPQCGEVSFYIMDYKEFAE